MMHTRTSPRPDTAGWADRAACRGMDPDLFFPPVGQSVAPAKAICARCPVVDACLAEALTLETSFDGFGIRGGLSAVERKAIRSRRRRMALT